MKKRDSFDIDEDEVEELVKSNRDKIESYVDECVEYLDGNEDLYPFRHDYDYFMDWVNDVELDMTDDINNGRYEAYSEDWDKLDRLVTDIVEDYLKKNGIDKNYKANIEMKDTAMGDSNEDLGWISTPELLEEDDFKSKEYYNYYVEGFKNLSKLTDPEEIIDNATDLRYFSWHTFKNQYVAEEIRNDLDSLIRKNIQIIEDQRKEKEPIKTFKKNRNVR